MLEEKLCLYQTMFATSLFNSTKCELQRKQEIYSGPRPVLWLDYHKLNIFVVRLKLVCDSCKTKKINLVCDYHIMTLNPESLSLTQSDGSRFSCDLKE